MQEDDRDSVSETTCPKARTCFPTSSTASAGNIACVQATSVVVVCASGIGTRNHCLWKYVFSGDCGVRLPRTAHRDGVVEHHCWSGEPLGRSRRMANGDKFRQYAMPLLYFADGAIDLARKRFFWTYGPQLIGVAVVFGVLLIGIWAGSARTENSTPRPVVMYQPPQVKIVSPPKPREDSPPRTEQASPAPQVSVVQTPVVQTREDLKDPEPEIFLSPDASAAGVTIEFRAGKKYLLVKTSRPVRVIGMGMREHTPFLEVWHLSGRDHPDGIGVLYENYGKCKEFFVYMERDERYENSVRAKLREIVNDAAEEVTRLRSKQELDELTDAQVTQAIQAMLPRMREERLNVYKTH